MQAYAKYISAHSLTRLRDTSLSYAVNNIAICLAGEMTDSVLHHLFHPVPELNKLPQTASKEERLKVIIVNLERQHQEVRFVLCARGRLQSRADHC